MTVTDRPASAHGRARPAGPNDAALGPHDFVIDELDVDLYIPARAARRVEFEATPGTYTAMCTLPGHEDMAITITVR